MGWKDGALALLGMVFSAGILALLFASISKMGTSFSPGDALAMLRSLPLQVLAIAFACQIAQTLLRAERYRCLLKNGSVTPPFLPLLGITFVRNMLVDLLPSRSGEIGYLILLKRVLGARYATGMVSLAASFLFDLAGLLGVLCLVGLWAAALSGDGNWLPLLLALCAIVGTGMFLFFHFIPRIGRWSAMKRRQWSTRLPGWMARLNHFADEVIEDMQRLGRQRVVLRILLLSLGIRIFKYGGMLCLLWTVLNTAFTLVPLNQAGGLVLGMIAGEAAAGLPLPSFMGLGVYEAGASAVLQGIGISASAALISTFLVHLISQSMDYSLGLLSLFGMTSLGWLSADPSNRRKSLTPLLTGAAGVLLCLLTVFWLGQRQPRGLSAAAYATAPASAEATLFPALTSPEASPLTQEDPNPQNQAPQTPPTEDNSAIPDGFAVWSSNRFGNHELLLHELRSGETRRLTHNEQVDWYPDLSPDGSKLIFCRSHQPGHSVREMTGWSIWVMDLESGSERQIAPEGYEPRWAGDNQNFVYVRNGTEVILQHLESSNQQILLRSGENALPSGYRWQTPDYLPSEKALAVTVRGSRRTKMVFWPQPQAPLELPEGCQLAWLPDGSGWIYVDQGPLDGAFYRIDRNTRARTALFEGNEGKAHRYFPRLSPDGAWLIYAESRDGHPHDSGAYDIHLRRSNDPLQTPFILSPHPGNDAWPTFHLRP
jgi:uncharacterized membrane protein YbhN (UPF0104 family)